MRRQALTCFLSNPSAFVSCQHGWMQPTVQGFGLHGWLCSMPPSCWPAAAANSTSPFHQCSSQHRMIGTRMQPAAQLDRGADQAARAAEDDMSSTTAASIAASRTQNSRSQQKTVNAPAEAIKAAARRSLTIVKLPQAVHEALQQQLDESEASTKELRIMGDLLASKRADLQRSRPRIEDRTKQLEETRHMRTAAGRLSAKALREAEFAAAGSEEGLLMNDAVYNTLLGLPAPLSSTKAQTRVRATPQEEGTARGRQLQYDDQLTMGSIVTASPTYYATAVRALSEIARADPSFRPRRVLDFGAGYGSALMAAQQVWPAGQIESIVAVEPSSSMSDTGAACQTALVNGPAAAGTCSTGAGNARTEPLTAGSSTVWDRSVQDRHQQAEAPGADSSLQGSKAPRVTWVKSLPQLMRKGSTSKEYDLVICSHLLDDLESQEDHLRLVKALWEVTAGVLVVIEPGSLQGYQAVARAREAVLSQSGRRAQRAQDIEQGRGATAGAHVLAPCTHDGACPLADYWEGEKRAKRTRVWCRFEQRVQLPVFTRRLLRTPEKQPPENRLESFSYVALRRGPRRQVPTVTLDIQPPGIQPPRLHARADPVVNAVYYLPEPVIRRQVGYIRSKGGSASPLADAGAAEDSSTDVGQETGPVLEESKAAQLRTLSHSLPTSSGSQQQEVNAPGKRATLFSKEQASPASESKGEESGVGSQQPLAVDGSSAADAEAASGPGGPAPLTAFEQQHPAYARGLLDSLLRLEQHGREWAPAADAPAGGDSAVDSDLWLPDAQQHEVEVDDEGDEGSGSEDEKGVGVLGGASDYTERERLAAIVDLLVDACGFEERAAAVKAAQRGTFDAAGGVTIVREHAQDMSATATAAAPEPGAARVLQQVRDSAKEWGRVVRPPLYDVPYHPRMTLWLCAPGKEPQGQREVARQRDSGSSSSLPDTGQLLKTFVRRTPRFDSPHKVFAYNLARDLSLGDLYPLSIVPAGQATRMDGTQGNA